MTKLDDRAFASLFREAYRKCFSYDLSTALTESESNHFSNEILERTGLVVGWKSLKNYSHHVLETTGVKRENPSVATLDTLARYVEDAPATDEGQRKRKESHYPYWFRYRDAFYRTTQKKTQKVPAPAAARSRRIRLSLFAASLLAIVIVIMLFSLRGADETTFTDDFDSVAEDSLASRSWFVKSVDPEYWQKRDEKSGHLTLYTLNGDNWPDSSRAPNIRNLLLRKLPFDCFVAEVHLTEFFPKQNWQQAGIVLLEDTSFTQKSLRMSIGYNDFSGGFGQPAEVIIQAITSLGGDFARPEEIAHLQVFALEPGTKDLVHANLQHSALRIEKRGNNYRLLYSCAQMKNSAFKEVVSTNFDLQPKYLGIFALKGFVQDSDAIPAHVDAFSLTDYPCGE